MPNTLKLNIFKSSNFRTKTGKHLSKYITNGQREGRRVEGEAEVEAENMAILMLPTAMMQPYMTQQLQMQQSSPTLQL